MNIFDLLIVQPIFNVLVFIYGVLPGGDFGIAIILLTILIRLLMWPLVKKQLHQTKVIREIQPALKKIKVKAKGNKQLEAQMMMELYRERGVNPFSSIGILLLQLPILIALYQVINIVTRERDRIETFTYNPLESLPPIADLIQFPDQFNETLFGVINLAQSAVSQSGIYFPLLVLAVAAAYLQYYQSRQITPKPESGQRLRDIMRSQANGKDVDQAELNAAISNRMLFFIPFITLFVSLYLPGALVLYFAVSSLVAIIQQSIILRQDTEEMEAVADKPLPKGKRTPQTERMAEKQAKHVVDATIIEEPVISPKAAKRKDGKPRKRKKR